MRLISKVQYSNYEEGEYELVAERTADETIKLIEAYDWKTNRNKFTVGITSPSIVIECKEGSFLQIALYYNNKFVLRFISDKGKIFEKTILEISQCHEEVKSYFKNKLDVSTYKKKQFQIGSVSDKLMTQSFIYQLESTSFFKYFLGSSWLQLFFAFAMVSLLIFKVPNLNIYSMVSFALIFFYLGGGMNGILLFNYYKHSKNKILQLSKGNNNFAFGDSNSPTFYTKIDIDFIIIFSVNSKNSPLSSFSWAGIKMKSNDILIIPNTLLCETKIRDKMQGVKIIEKHTAFPKIKSTALL